jgi:hypothetical protein
VNTPIEADRTTPYEPAKFDVVRLWGVPIQISSRTEEKGFWRPINNTAEWIQTDPGGDWWVTAAVPADDPRLAEDSPWTRLMSDASITEASPSFLLPESEMAECKPLFSGDPTSAAKATSNEGSQT